MIYTSAISEAIIAPTSFRPEFSHSLDPEQTWTQFLDTGLPELWGRVLATEEFGKIDRLSDHGYGQLQGDLDGGLR